MLRSRSFPTHLPPPSSPMIRAYITAETLIWSAWNFIAPIFAIFVTEIEDGTVDGAALAFSIYLIVRVIFELFSGKYLARKSIAYKFLLTVFGVSIITVAYVGLAFSQLMIQIHVFYALIGMGIGLATPAKNSLFSSHLDHKKESLEWGILDASVFLSMAVASFLGGLIARLYGFETLFFVAAAINTLGLAPYLLYIKKFKRSIEETILDK